jgi:hypothetical protein
MGVIATDGHSPSLPRNRPSLRLSARPFLTGRERDLTISLNRTPQRSACCSERQNAFDGAECGMAALGSAPLWLRNCKSPPRLILVISSRQVSTAKERWRFWRMRRVELAAPAHPDQTNLYSQRKKRSVRYRPARTGYFGFLISAGGVFLSAFMTSSIARSSCGSRPLAMSEGSSTTVISGSTPRPSMIQSPSA